MAITFKSVGHFFASFFTAVKNDLPKVMATAAVVESVTAAIPVYGPLAVSAEKLAYAAMGELAAVLHSGDAAVKTKLQDAGLDIAVIQSIEALVATYPSIAAFAASLTAKK
ncbi:MAG TPA: hypothetical protein VM554_15555 [Acidisarcina sp.]|nr:hypothetical protein [Acidisarcina sp.]